MKVGHWRKGKRTPEPVGYPSGYWMFAWSRYTTMNVRTHCKDAKLRQNHQPPTTNHHQQPQMDNKKRRKSFWERAQHGTEGDRNEDPYMYVATTFTRLAAIYLGQDETYHLDSIDKGLTCTSVFNKNNNPAKDLDGLSFYRLFAIMSALSVSHPDDLVHCLTTGGCSTTLHDALLRYNDSGLPARHLCPHGSKKEARCVFSSHLVISPAKDNEVDKHFHHFLHHQNPTVSAAAVQAFGPGGILVDAYVEHYSHPYQSATSDPLLDFLSRI